MKNLLKLLVIIPLFCMASCKETAPNEHALTKEIEERYQSFVSAMNGLETEQLKDFYSNDPRFYWVEDGMVQYPDKSTLIASLDGLVDQLKSSDMQVINTEVEIISSEAAMFYAEYEQSLMMQSGFGFEINGAMTILLEKENGVWRFLIGHSSTKKERG